MTDHPLTPDPVKEYIQGQGLETVLNVGINKVLREKPTDALSALAVYLMDNADKKPIFNKFECEKTLKSFNTHVYLDFGGQTKCRHSQTFSYNSDIATEAEESQTQLREHIGTAIGLITNDVNKLLANADLSLVKKTDLVIKKYCEETFNTTQHEGEEQKKDEGANVVGQIIARTCSEAILHAIVK
jgi:hypothetical protein